MAGNTLVTRLLLDTGVFDKNIKSSRRQIQNFDNTIKKASSTMMATIGSLGAVTSATVLLGNAINKNINFEKSISSLRSLTGLAGPELDYLKKQAADLGSKTTQSASQVADAFTLIGSKQPELLKSKEALAAVTKYAITLSEAAGISVVDAAAALSGSLNQMGEGASSASEYINILAAASQKGAADIPYLNAAIERSGGAASSVGIKFNELVASIEAIAPKVTEASQAGTYLRNIFLTLEASTDKNLKPSVVGLSSAIKELASRNMDASAMTKMFGKENVTAALALVNAKDSYLDYAKEIVGTSTAFEQQKINTDNVTGAINSLASAWEGLILNMQGGNGVMKKAIDQLTGLLNGANNILNPIDTAKGQIKDQLTAEYSDFVKQRTEEYKKLMSEKAAEKRAQKDLLKKMEEDRVSYSNSAILKRNNPVTPMWDNAYKEFEKNGYNPFDVKGGLAKDGFKYGSIKRGAFDKDALAFDELRAEVLKGMISETSALAKPLEIPAKLNVDSAASADSITTATKGYNAEIDPEFWKLKDTSAVLDKLRADLEKGSHLKPVEITTELADAYIKNNSKVGKDQAKWEDFGKNAALKDLEAMSFAAGSINTMLSQTASLLAQSGNQWGAWGLQTVGTIAEVAGQYASLLAMAMASAVAEQGKLPFPYNIAAMAATAGGIISIIASLPKFATGGIVGGSSYAGDNVLARVNSGEMILDRGKQMRLLNMLETGSSGAPAMGGDVTFRIKGDTLVGTFGNYNRKKSKLR